VVLDKFRAPAGVIVILVPKARKKQVQVIVHLVILAKQIQVQLKNLALHVTQDHILPALGHTIAHCVRKASFNMKKAKRLVKNVTQDRMKKTKDLLNVLCVLVARMRIQKDIFYVKNVQRAKALIMERQLVQIVSQENILKKQTCALSVIITQSLLLELPNVQHVNQAKFHILEQWSVTRVRQGNI